MYYVVHVLDVFQVMFHPQLLLKWQTCMLQVQVLLEGWMYHTATHFTVMMKHFGAILFPLGEGVFFFSLLLLVVGFFVCFCLFLFFLIYFNLFFFPCIQEFELQGEISFEEHCKHIVYGLFPLQVTLIFFCSGTGEAWRGDLTACHLQWLDLLCTCKSLAKIQDQAAAQGRLVC